MCEIIAYIMTQMSYSLVCAVYVHIIIVMQIYEKALNITNADHSVECLFTIKFIPSVILCAMRGAVFSAYQYHPGDWKSIYISSYY